MIQPAAPKAAQDLVDSYQILLSAKRKIYEDMNKAARAEWQADPYLHQNSYETYLKEERPDVGLAKSEMLKAAKAVTDAQLATNIPGADKLDQAKKQLTKIEKGINEAGSVWVSCQYAYMPGCC